MSRPENRQDNSLPVRIHLYAFANVVEGAINDLGTKDADLWFDMAIYALHTRWVEYIVATVDADDPDDGFMTDIT
jgi:hypothetical protein